MSVESAKAKLDAQPGDPATGYISKADHQDSYTELVDDTALTGATTAEALTISGNLNGRDPDNLVAGPGSSTDNALVRFDGTGGKTVQGSGITVDDSGSFTTDITVDKSAPRVVLTSAAGSERYVRYRTAGVDRWLIGTNSTAEGGANAGSDLSLLGYTDAGSLLRTDLVVTRSTGRWTFGSVGATAGLELGAAGPRIMSGTGSPEGVVTAPVGSQWTDTAATTGAVKWIKATGTGNTGWVVEYGDTGQRNLEAESLSNSWALASSIFRLRRIGATVGLSIGVDKTSATGDDVYTLPSGFRPVSTTYGISSSATDDYAHMVVTSGGVISFSRTYMHVAAHYLSMSFQTSDAWPTSLPGSAA